MSGTVPGPHGRPRCRWCAAAPSFSPTTIANGGLPVLDDIRLFEKLCLESFQSGLSWRTILAKRENFRAAFAGFDFRKMALLDEAEVVRLLADAGIIRHRGKIEAVISNARRACELVEAEGSLAAVICRFEPNKDDAEPQSRSTSPASEKLSKELRKRGWKFVGPTTVHAFMQAMGWSTTMPRDASCDRKPSRHEEECAALHRRTSGQSDSDLKLPLTHKAHLRIKSTFISRVDFTAPVLYFLAFAA